MRVYFSFLKNSTVLKLFMSFKFLLYFVNNYIFCIIYDDSSFNIFKFEFIYFFLF